MTQANEEKARARAHSSYSSIRNRLFTASTEQLRAVVEFFDHPTLRPSYAALLEEVELELTKRARDCQGDG
jgi:hypothetical protein